MNSTIESPIATALPKLNFAQLQPCITQACQRIAPTWPLDQFIAVNPYWGFVEQPIAHAARQLNKLSGSPMVMPRSAASFSIIGLRWAGFNGGN